MKTSILAVFDEADLQAVPNALEFFRRVGLEQLMVLHNPSLGLKGVVTAQYDARISELRTAMKQAAERNDYLAAANYKEELDGAETDRDLAIREGWTKVPQPDREAVYKRIFGNIGTEAIICLNENMRKDQLFAALNGLVAVWPKDVEHGEFSIVWPMSVPLQKAVPAPQSVPQNVPRGTQTAVPQKKVKESFDQTSPEGRRAALVASRFGGVASACKKHGIPTTGHTMPELIELIIAKEFTPVSA